MLVCYLFVYCSIIKTDIMKTPLEKAYDKLRKLDIEYNSELLTIMSNLASEAFSVGYNKAVKNTQEVYEKVYEL